MFLKKFQLLYEFIQFYQIILHPMISDEVSMFVDRLCFNEIHIESVYNSFTAAFFDVLRKIKSLKGIYNSFDKSAIFQFTFFLPKYHFNLRAEHCYFYLWLKQKIL